MKGQTKTKTCNIIDLTQAPCITFGVGVKRGNLKLCLECGQPIKRDEAWRADTSAEDPDGHGRYIVIQHSPTCPPEPQLKRFERFRRRSQADNPAWNSRCLRRCETVATIRARMQRADAMSGQKPNAQLPPNTITLTRSIHNHTEPYIISKTKISTRAGYLKQARSSILAACDQLQLKGHEECKHPSA